MTQTKQAMQNTIKNLQAKSEYINKLQDKGNKTLVLQLGSHTIKLGFANQKAPFTMRPFIAYKKSSSTINNNNKLTKPIPPSSSSKSILSQPSPCQTFDYQSFKTQYQKLQQRLKIQNIISYDNRTLKGKPRSKQIVNIQKIIEFKEQKNILFGEEALWVEKDNNYIFRKPLKYGFFNVEEDNLKDNHQIDQYQDEQNINININQYQQYKYQQTIIDIQNIITYMILTKLKIPFLQLRNFSLVIVIPDIFSRLHMKHLTYRLFKSLSFKRIYLHLQSIMGCFGTAVSTACVIDIGHQKINICCVDQGIIIPQTLIRKNYGMKYITKSLCKIFAERVNDKDIGEIKVIDQADLNQIDKVKEISTVIRDPDQAINRIYQIQLLRKKNHVSFQVAYSDSICVISNSIFSQIWNSFQNHDNKKDQFNLHSQHFDLYHDTQDYFEQYSGGGHLLQISQANNQQIQPSICHPFFFQPIDQLIITCLNNIKDKQQRKRYSSNILFIGGGSQMNKLQQQIINKLNKQLGYDQESTQKVDIAADLNIREIMPIYASWLGGTVIPKLDSLRDLWIERGKFLGEMPENNQEDEEDKNDNANNMIMINNRMIDRRYFTRKEQSEQWGITYLKEKVPFIW